MALTQRHRLILAGVFFYLFFLLAWMPAEVVARLVAERSQQRVFLLDPQGTAWKGSASQVVLTSSGEQIMLPKFSWNTRLDRLIRGQIAAELALGNESHALVATTPSSIALEDASVTLPAQLLTFAMPSLAVWQPSGDLKLDTKRLLVRKDGAEGQGTLLWQRAGTRLSRIQPLGDYSVNMDGKKDQLGFSVTTLSGSLQLNGQGVWRSKTDWEFNGQARADQGKQAELGDLLKLISRRSEGGVYLLQFKSNNLSTGGAG